MGMALRRAMSETWAGDEPGMASETRSPISTCAVAYCLNLTGNNFLCPPSVSSMLPSANNMNELDESP